MAQNLKMDPTKRDYVFENGSPVGSDRVEEAVYFAILIPQNNWLYGAQGQGSYIYTLQGQRRTSSVEKDFAAYAKDAVNRQVIATGQAKDVEVTNLEATRTGTSNRITVTPSESQLTNQLNFTPV